MVGLILRWIGNPFLVYSSLEFQQGELSVNFPSQFWPQSIVPLDLPVCGGGGWLPASSVI